MDANSKCRIGLPIRIERKGCISGVAICHFAIAERKTMTPNRLLNCDDKFTCLQIAVPAVEMSCRKD